MIDRAPPGFGRAESYHLIESIESIPFHAAYAVETDHCPFFALAAARFNEA
jgi:hypothetical protein